MRKSWLLILLLCVPVGSVFAVDTVVPAALSCRADVLYPDTCRTDSKKLSVRSDASSNKSWIRFNVGDYDLGTLRAATLTVFLIEDESGAHTCDVSAVNDDCTDNIHWTISKTDGTGLTWNTAPGNLNTDMKALDATKTTFLQTVSAADALAGHAFEINVLSSLQADTDGIVQFVLHNASTLEQFGTHNHSTVEWRPYLTLTYPPVGADYPTPQDGAIVETNLSVLSWENPEPNTPHQPIFCDVYLGTEPNRLSMDKVSLGADVSEVFINTANFKKFGALNNMTTYHWVVDCTDTDKGLLEGEFWSFYTNDNMAPEVHAGDDQVVWLGKSGVAGEETVTLNGETSDDELPGPYTVKWTQTANAAPTVTILNDGQDAATVLMTERGTYEFVLTANDGDEEASDTVIVYVGDDTCDASHLSTGILYNDADANEDCIVDLADLVQLFALSWLNCTDDLTQCGQ